jgi:hypothetical protein
MTTTLNNLWIAAALSCLAVTACDNARVTTKHVRHPVELTQHGNTSCVLVDNRVFCAPAKMRASMRMASSTAI